jgi:hypothetical protein
METPIKNKLLSVISDPAASKPDRKSAAEILAWYARFDIPSESDKTVVGQLAEWHAERFWTGASTIAEHHARNFRPT